MSVGEFFLIQRISPTLMSCVCVYGASSRKERETTRTHAHYPFGYCFLDGRPGGLTFFALRPTSSPTDAFSFSFLSLLSFSCSFLSCSFLWKCPCNSSPPIIRSRNIENFGRGRVLVNMSAGCTSVGTYSGLISPSSTDCLKKL